MSAQNDAHSRCDVNAPWLFMPDDDIGKWRARAFGGGCGGGAEEDEAEDFIIGGDVERGLDVGVVCRPRAEPAGGVTERARGDDEVLADGTAGEDLFDARHGAVAVDAARYHHQERRAGDEAGFFRGQGFVGVRVFPRPDIEQGGDETLLRGFAKDVDAPRVEVAVVGDAGGGAQDLFQLGVAWCGLLHLVGSQRVAAQQGVKGGVHGVSGFWGHGGEGQFAAVM